MTFVKRRSTRPVIDLDGPEGNVFALIGIGIKWCRDTGDDPKKFAADMKAGTYVDAVKTFDRYFGAHVDIVGGPTEEIDDGSAT